jgi:hypothetical protein
MRCYGLEDGKDLPTDESQNGDSGMSYESRDSGTSTALILFAVLGVAALFVALACGGVIWWFLQTIQPVVQMAREFAEAAEKTQQAVQAFQQKIAANQIDDAYASTTANFKKEMSREAFAEFVRKHPSLAKASEIDFSGGDPGLDAADPYYELGLRQSGKKHAEFLVTLVKENDVWKVDKIEVDETEQIVSAAKSFLNAVQPRWDDAAYRFATADFRTRWPRAKLEAFLRQHPLPRGFVLEKEFKDELNGRQVHYIGIYDASQEDSADFNIVVTKEGNTWKVHDLELWDE